MKLFCDITAEPQYMLQHHYFSGSQDDHEPQRPEESLAHHATALLLYLLHLCRPWRDVWLDLRHVCLHVSICGCFVHCNQSWAHEECQCVDSVGSNRCLWDWKCSVNFFFIFYFFWWDEEGDSHALVSMSIEPWFMHIIMECSSAVGLVTVMRDNDTVPSCCLPLPMCSACLVITRWLFGCIAAPQCSVECIHTYY